MRYKVDFFQPKEFICPCCGKGTAAAALVFALDEVRRVWNLPIRINSGWRCERHNRDVGGVEGSRHLVGLAADVAPFDADLIAPFKHLLESFFSGREGWEFKLYKTFVHIGAPRGCECTKWDGSLLSVSVRSL